MCSKKQKYTTEMDIRGYIDRGKCVVFSLLILNSFIGQFVHPLEGKGMV